MEFITISKVELIRIQHLWEQLNSLHLSDSRYFKDHYASFTFEERIKKFDEYPEDDIRVECIQNELDEIKGYCISTIKNSMGEIDSLYLEEDIRSNGFGKMLVQNALNWMKTFECNRIIVTVAEGHETVFDFYQEIGFYPRLTTLELRS